MFIPTTEQIMLITGIVKPGNISGKPADQWKALRSYRWKALRTWCQWVEQLPPFVTATQTGNHPPFLQPLASTIFRHVIKEINLKIQSAALYNDAEILKLLGPISRCFELGSMYAFGTLKNQPFAIHNYNCLHWEDYLFHNVTEQTDLQAKKVAKELKQHKALFDATFLSVNVESHSPIWGQPWPPRLQTPTNVDPLLLHIFQGIWHGLTLQDLNFGIAPQTQKLERVLTEAVGKCKGQFIYCPTLGHDFSMSQINDCCAFAAQWRQQTGNSISLL